MNLDRAEVLASQCLSALSEISEKDCSNLIDSISSAHIIYVFGVGRSGLVAQSFAVRLVQLGLRVYFIGDMTTPLIAKDDLVILISNSGDTMSVVKTAEIARRIGTRVISITSSRNNQLAKNSDAVISISQGYSKISPLGTIFEDSALIFLDSIVPDLMTKLKITEQDMKNRHAIWV